MKQEIGVRDISEINGSISIFVFTLEPLAMHRGSA